MAEDLIRKKYAALAYALGVARGTLDDVLRGEFSAASVRRIYEATAVSRIARSIGVAEAEVSVDWNDFLSEAEKYKIQGYENAEPATEPNSGE